VIPQLSVQDSISSLTFGPTTGTGTDLLVGSSWDSRVYIWVVRSQGTQIEASETVCYAHEGPVLCTAFLRDGRILSGSCDNSLKMLDIGAPTQVQVIGKVSQMKKHSFTHIHTQIAQCSSQDNLCTRKCQSCSNRIVGLFAQVLGRETVEFSCHCESG